MSSLLPVQGAAPATARVDGGSDARRSGGAAADRFADSLATARANRQATPDARDTPHDTTPAIGARPRAATARAQSPAQLGGAMRYAALRGDSARAGDTGDTPATTDTVVDSVNSDGTPRQAPAVALAVGAPVAAPVELPLAGSPVAMPDVIALDAAVVAAPVLPATAAVTTSEHAPAHEDEPVAAPALDASALAPSAAATAAAMALVSTLPLPAHEAMQPVDVDALLDADTQAGANANGHGAAMPEPVTDDASQQSRIAALAELHATLQAVPEATMVAAPVLVEDHFDAPAAALSDAPALPTAGVHSATAPVTTATAPMSAFEAWLRSDDDDTLTASIALSASEAAADVTAATHDIVAATPSSTGTAAGAPSGTGGAKGSTAVIRDLAALAPEFREKLERVIERMRAEYGREVTVVETARSQERQDALYAQGRTTPGPVVTWTRNSRHSTGMAADLMVDGKWTNPEGYADLATVAEEEGLRTLGSRDAGHVEMPGQRTVSAETLGSLLSDLQGEAGDGARQASATIRRARVADEAQAPVIGLARVAEVAQVARVATVAQVARVAEVARPGVPRTSHSGGSEVAMPALAVSAVNTIATDTTVPERVTAPVAVNMAERISQLMDLQGTQASKPLNSVLLRMGEAGGVEDQIRIDTRGTSVDARLGLGNAQQAAALTDRISELRDALERRGLTADGVRVQATSAARATDSVSFSRPAAQVLELAATRAASDSQMQGNTRDQGGREQQQREALAREQSRPSQRSSTDDARNRSRREQQEARR